MGKNRAPVVSGWSRFSEGKNKPKPIISLPESRLHDGPPFFGDQENGFSSCALFTSRLDSLEAKHSVIFGKVQLANFDPGAQVFFFSLVFFYQLCIPMARWTSASACRFVLVGGGGEP